MERGSDFNNKLTSDQPFTTDIREQLIAIENEYQQKKQKKGYQLMIKARLLMVLTYLTRYFRDPEKKVINQTNKILFEWKRLWRIFISIIRII